MSKFFSWNRDSGETPLGQAIKNYLSQNPELATRLEEVGAQVSILGLPDEYDDVPYRTTINGINVNTVGEAKALFNEWDHAE